MRREEAYKRFRKEHEFEIEASKNPLLGFSEYGIRKAFYAGFKQGKAKLKQNK